MNRNREIAALFNQAADVLALLEENAFRVLGMRKVGRVLEELPEDAAVLATSGRLEETPGIGRHSAERIREYLRTGHICEFERWASQVPAGVLQMMAISSVGVKTAHLLWKEGGITSIEALQKALQTDTLPELKGLGTKKKIRILQNLEFMQAGAQRIGIGWALPLAKDYCQRLETVAGISQAQYCGSLRRGKETVGDIDILICAEASMTPAIAKTLENHPQTTGILAAGATKVSLRTKIGLQLDFRIVPAASWGAALQYFTGSKEHNVRVRELAVKKGYKLNEWGLFQGQNRIAGETEEGIYDILELAWLPPEMREDKGEVELAAAMFRARQQRAPDLADPRLEFLGRNLPPLWPTLEATDIRGDLHLHTTASDGTASLEDMVAAAKRHGYQYIAITDHSKSQIQANGLKVPRLLEHIAAIAALAKTVKGITVLAGSEVDILADGSLDYPDDVLEQLDWVVASPHSALTQEAEAATDRLIRAASHPLVDVLGHPTGRLIAGRRGLEPEMGRVVSAAARGGVALEINANEMRLDLRDAHAHLAVQTGVPLCINTDAHSAEQMDQLIYGILTARRAWARPENVLNTWPIEKIRQWQRQRRCELKAAKSV